jgi:hypothetical protein
MALEEDLHRSYSLPCIDMIGVLTAAAMGLGTAMYLFGSMMGGMIA